jgi:hypothetical protein
MNTLPYSAFLDAPCPPTHWPLTRDRDLAPSCELGSTVGEVFAYNALERVFASMTQEGLTEFWRVLSLTSARSVSKRSPPGLVKSRLGLVQGEGLDPK